MVFSQRWFGPLCRLGNDGGELARIAAALHVFRQLGRQPLASVV
jgi:hypothetical protein